MESNILGRVSLYHPDIDGAFFSRPLYLPVNQSEESQAGLDLVDPPTDNEFAYSNTGFMGLAQSAADAPTLEVLVADQLEKHYPMGNAYEVFVTIAYAEKNNEVEQLDPAERQEIYDRAIRVAVGQFAGAATGVD